MSEPHSYKLSETYLIIRAGLNDVIQGDSSVSLRTLPAYVEYLSGFISPMISGSITLNYQDTRCFIDFAYFL